MFVLEAIVIQLLFLAIVTVGLYFIIKKAVKDGIIQAHKKINEQDAQDGDVRLKN